MTTTDMKVYCGDAETLKELLIWGGKDPKTGEWIYYEVSYRRNDLDAMVKHLRENSYDAVVTYNGAKFDLQVLQYILDNHEQWYDLTWKQICSKVYQFVQEMISNQDYNILPPYKEQYMDIKTVDLFLISHYDNENKRTSLKWCMYSMDMDIELMDTDHSKEGLTEEEIEETVRYWKNDIEATCELYNYLLGECKHPDYKGKNKIQLRMDLIEEYKLPWSAINWNDVKIGDELNKRTYLELTGMTHNQLWDKVKNKKTKTGFTFGDCYPKYWKFESEKFQKFATELKKTVVNLNAKQEFKLECNGTQYMIAKGGLHSCEGVRVMLPKTNERILDADVGSEYPNAIRKRGLYPAHLGKKWNEAYIGNIDKRLHAKAMYKKTGEKKYDNFQETYKLVLNGSFGKLIDRTNWQYDAYIGMCVTIGCQIEILMLIEDLELADIHVVTANTDGVTCIVHEDKIQQYYEICTAWEKQVGNDILGKLEYVEYSKMVQLSVNDYIAEKTADWVEADGIFTRKPIDKPLKDRLKKKGDYLTSYELHKNKSKSIIPYALEQYWINGIEPEESVKSCRDLYMFGIAKKASRDYSYEGIDKSNGHTNRYKKLIRYYCAQKGAKGAEKLYKIKNEGSDKTGPARSNVESSSEYQVVFNHRIDITDWESLKVDYRWYTEQIKSIIHKVDPEKKREDQIAKSGALLLF